MGKEGYISLHRSLLDNPIFNSEPYTKGQAWVTILMLANYKEGFVQIKNGELIKVERGECGYSELALSDIFKWSRGKVKRFLNLLESEKMIQQKIRSNRTIIKICNYELYQNRTVNDTVNSTVNDTVNGHLTIQQTDINNNDNNDNNEKNNIYGLKIKKFQKPTLEEIKSYCAERNNNVDANKFFDFYESNGWKVGKNPMKDWKASVRTWERNNFGKENKQEEFDYDSMPYNAFR